MDFGIFTEQIRRGSSQGEAFVELFELVDAAETWGLDVVWLAEMLVNPTRSVLSAPLLVASWIVARTKRLRVGTAVQLLPLNDPLRVPYEESQGRFFEALEIILSAWKGEPFSYEGKFYRFADTTVTPRPYQQPHPPVRMAATTPETFPHVGRMGLPIFVGLRGMNIPELAGHVRRYREAWREAGHSGDGDVCLRIPVYAAPTEKAAVEEPEETIMYYFRRQADLTRAPIGRPGTGPAERRVTQARALSSLSYPEILSTKVAFGTGPGLIDRFTQLREELSLNGIAAELNPGGLLPKGQETRTLQILTHQVMPAFK